VINTERKGDSEVKAQRVIIGKQYIKNREIVSSDITTAEFIGERLAMTDFDIPLGRDPKGYTIDQILYRTQDGRLVVYSEVCRNQTELFITYKLEEIDKSALDANGRFAELGAEAGYYERLTLDQALAKRRN
jgi:hypothetical protein